MRRAGRRWSEGFFLNRYGQEFSAVEVCLQCSTTPEEPIVLAALKACGVLKLLESGTRVHSDSAGNLTMYAATALVDMYAKCGRMTEAQNVFDTMERHDTVSWNALVLGYAVNGEEELALHLLRRMNDSGCTLNDRSYVSGLMACAKLAEKEPGIQMRGKTVLKTRCLEKGMELHARAAKGGWDSDVFVANGLVCLYSKCGSLVDARAAFDRMSRRDVVSWTSLITGCVENVESLLALDIFHSLMNSGQREMINTRTLTAALRACSSLATTEAGKLVDGKLLKLDSLQKGRDIHSEAVRMGEWDMYLESTLLDMYSKCGSLADALAVFERMQRRDVVSWTALIQGYAENGEGKEALKLFHAMHCEGCSPNAQTFVAALMACASGLAQQFSDDGNLVLVEAGKRLHCQVAERGYELDAFVGNTMIGMYAKCGSLADAHKVFDRMVDRDTVSWTSLMLGYFEAGEADTCLTLFWKMVSEGCCVLDSRSFLPPLMSTACLAEREQGTRTGQEAIIKAGCLDIGMNIHSQAVRSCCDADVFFASALVDMYGKCGSMVDARRVFDTVAYHDAVLWNTLLLGYVANGEAEAVFDLFCCMQRQGCSPDTQTFVAALTASAASALKEEGKRAGKMLVKLDSLTKGMLVHSEAARGGNESNIFVSNTLVDMYGKCGSLVDARAVFDRMEAHDLVSWNSIILASCDCGEAKVALELFSSMHTSSLKVEPDSRTLVAALTACAALVDVATGRLIHARICRSGMESSTVVSSHLVDFYGQCGSMSVAQLVFDSSTSSHNMDNMDATGSWNCLLAGYSRAGADYSERAFEIVERMREEGVRADSSTVHLLLTACSHSGLVDRGMSCFRRMLKDNSITPSVVHLRCLVDLLGRANRLDEAANLLNQHQCLKDDSLAWTAFLASCARWRNVGLGEQAYRTVLRLDERNAGAYVLMANLHAC